MAPEPTFSGALTSEVKITLAEKQTEKVKLVQLNS